MKSKHLDKDTTNREQGHSPSADVGSIKTELVSMIFEKYYLSLQVQFMINTSSSSLGITDRNDAIQDFFVKKLFKMSTERLNYLLSPDGKKYLIKMFKYYCIDIIRQNRAQKNIQTVEINEELINTILSQDYNYSIDSRIEELIEDIAEKSELNYTERKVLDFMIEGRPVPEVAAILKTTPNNVYAINYRIRKKVMRHIKKIVK